MANPTVEIGMFNLRGRTVEDPSTQDGKTFNAVAAGITKIPGFIRVGWGHRLDDPDTYLFLVDWESLAHHQAFMAEKNNPGEPFTPRLMNLLSKPIDGMYHVTTNTQTREYLYSPITTVTYYHQPDEAAFAAATKDLFHHMSKADACRGLAWGEAMTPPLFDASGFLKDGKGVVMMAGWDSEQGMQEAMEKLTEKGKRVAAAVKKVVSYAVQFNVVEKSGHMLHWHHV